MFSLNGIQAGYGATTILRGINLVVPDRSVVALLGPNGAGKTTLLRVASGLLRPTRGELVLDGSVVTGETPHALCRRGVCHVPEGRGIFRSLTVRDNWSCRASPAPRPSRSSARSARSPGWVSASARSPAR